MLCQATLFFLFRKVWRGKRCRIEQVEKGVDQTFFHFVSRVSIRRHNKSRDLNRLTCGNQKGNRDWPKRERQKRVKAWQSPFWCSIAVSALQKGAKQRDLHNQPGQRAGLVEIVNQHDSSISARHQLVKRWSKVDVWLSSSSSPYLRSVFNCFALWWPDGDSSLSSSYFFFEFANQFWNAQYWRCIDCRLLASFLLPNSINRSRLFKLFLIVNRFRIDCWFDSIPIKAEFVIRSKVEWWCSLNLNVWRQSNFALGSAFFFWSFANFAFKWEIWLVS